MRRKLLSVLVALLLSLPQQASALLCSILGCSCAVSTTPVAFGVYNVLSSSPLDGVGEVQATCTGLLDVLFIYDITLGKGASSTSFSPRKMASGGNRLNYDLYTDAARTTIWGDGISDGTSKVSGSAAVVLLGVTVRHNIYGRIPSGQTSVLPGSYSDSVVVTVTYY